MVWGLVAFFVAGLTRHIVMRRDARWHSAPTAVWPARGDAESYIAVFTLQSPAYSRDKREEEKKKKRLKSKKKKRKKNSP